jgi:hypothetical protein
MLHGGGAAAPHGGTTRQSRQPGPS